MAYNVFRTAFKDTAKALQASALADYLVSDNLLMEILLESLLFNFSHLSVPVEEEKMCKVLAKNKKLSSM